MSEDYKIEQGLDENGNIRVSISQEVVFLTQEELHRASENLRKLQVENAKLREENERLIKLNEIYKESYGKGYRDGQWNIRKRNMSIMKHSEILEQCSRQRIIEIAKYWCEEALFWQGICWRNNNDKLD